MTERRRNIFVLLFVAALAIASVVIAVAKPTRLGLDLRGGVELVYEATPAVGTGPLDNETLTRTIEIMRQRVDPTGTLEPEIQTSGNNQVSVALPGFQDIDEAIRQVGRTARLYFYDWETNVVGPDGRPAPEDPSVTGAGTPTGAGAGETALEPYAAVERASERQPQRFDQMAKGAPTYYLVDNQDQRVLAGPQGVREDLFSEDAAQARQTGIPTQQQTAQQERYEVKTVPTGTVLLRAEATSQRSGRDPDNPPAPPNKYYVLRDNVALQGQDIENPVQSQDQQGLPAVSFDFTSEGRDIWERVTREIAQRGQEQLIGGTGPQHFAIALDNQLISVPQIDPQENPDGISGANGSQISGGFTLDTARELAELLRTGALPVNLNLISQSQISASLGQEALDQAVVAGGLGFLVVAIFLIGFYRVLGLLAVTGLALYSLFFYALVNAIPITLTLPGIAGLILTIGVAADANIVIFERIKEELRGGRTIKSAIATGYKRGLTAIIDANIVTFVTAFILFTLATGGIKGFAFVLGVGTLVSFFTAVVFTQAVLGLIGQSKLITGRAAFGAGGNPSPRRFDFMGKARVFFSLSGLILVIGALAIGGKGVPFGIDFESGTKITTGVEQAQTSEADLRSFLTSRGVEAPKIQRIANADLGTPRAFQITIGDVAPEQLARIRTAIDDRFGTQNAQGQDTFSSTTVGPTFGAQIARTAIIAIIASLLVISLYIWARFEWKYAVPVLIAITHDILIVAGVYAALGAEVTSSTVAALLTILGYSLYDTIIVFDRIRENVPRMPRATFAQIVNQSMSEVLTRSLATSFVTLLPVTALFFFGGATLQDFALALIIGTISGVYSSIFIASPVLAHWKEREPVWKRRAATVAASHGGRIPAYADAPKAAYEEAHPGIGGGGLSTDQPEAVSEQEFREMVRELEVEEPARAGAGSGARQPRGSSSPESPREPELDPNNPADARRLQAQRRREARQRRAEEDA